MEEMERLPLTNWSGTLQHGTQWIEVLKSSTCLLNVDTLRISFMNKSRDLSSISLVKKASNESSLDYFMVE